MSSQCFYRLGQWIYKHHRGVIVFWVMLFVLAVPFLTLFQAPFESTGFDADGSQSMTAQQQLNASLPYYKNQFIILYHSDSLRADRSTFQKKIKWSLAHLSKLDEPYEVIYPKAGQAQISKDKHTAYVTVMFKNNEPFDSARLSAFRDAVRTPSNMTMRFGGEAIFLDGVEKQTQVDLLKADAVATPASVITLLFVFGTVVAALVPLGLGAGCALVILSVLYGLGSFFTLSIFTLNIALLLGLCLSLDYAIFIIFRYREELRDTASSMETMIARTLATAGRSVFFSGLAVFISLSALLLFPINILFSIGVGGLVAVFLAVMVALTLLPACLSLLKHRVNCCPLPGLKSALASTETQRHPFWRRFATMVTQRPVGFFLLIFLFLLFIGSPFLNVRFGISDLHILPKHTESYQFLNAFEQNFDPNALTPIVVVAKVEKGSVLSKNNIGKLYRYVEKIKKLPDVDEVNSIVSFEKDWSRKRYQAFYQMPKSRRPDEIKQLLKTTTKHDFTLINVVSREDSNSPSTLKLVKKLRELDAGRGLTIQITGAPASNLDVIDCIAKLFPYALLWIMALTYCVLLCLLRSVFLPFKAILMNSLSLCASYGVLVFVFQEGHLHEWLNFIPQHMLDISLMIIIFCALFGFSMDYEVFLLSRIKEHHDKTGKNTQSIVFGIEKSSRIITSAALIVIILCGSFMFAEVLMVKEFGLGIAIAIFVDAFIIRLFLVPSTMALVKQVNWYMPRWLERIL